MNWQHRTNPALRLKHRSGSCGTASALPVFGLCDECAAKAAQETEEL